MKYRNIEAERIRLGITQKEFCRRLGICSRSWNNYLSGKNPIPSNVLIKIRDECGCTADYLLEEFD